MLKLFISIPLLKAGEAVFKLKFIVKTDVSLIYDIL